MVELVLVLVVPIEETKIGIWPVLYNLNMYKKNNFKNFSNVETRRMVILNRNSSAADIEKFDRQVSAKASLRSADLREYWQTGIDRNRYLDEPAARELNESNHPNSVRLCHNAESK